MVKKIRLIEDETDTETDDTLESSGTSVSKEFIELAKSMDWKLWEMLQVMQRVERKLSLVDSQEEKQDEKSKK